MRNKKIINGITAAALIAGAVAIPHISAAAAVYDQQTVDISSFGTYSNGESVIDTGKEWQKIDLTPYTKKSGESTTKVTISYSNYVGSGDDNTRNIIGFFDNDITEYTQDSTIKDGIICYGEMDKEHSESIYAGGTRIKRATELFALNEYFDVSLEIDFVNNKITGKIGDTDIEQSFDASYDSVDIFGIRSWNDPQQYKIKDLKISIETTDIKRVIRTYTCVANGKELASTAISGFVGNAVSYSPFAYIKDEDGCYYRYNNIDSQNGSVPAVKGIFENEDDTEYLNYTKAENVVFYTEAENGTKTGSHSIKDGGKSDLASGGYQAGNTAANQGDGWQIEGIDIPVSGTYKVTANTVGSQDPGTLTNHRKNNLAFDDEEPYSDLRSYYTQPAFSSDELHLTAGTHTFKYLSFYGDDWAQTGPYLDYLVIELVSVDPVTAPITDAVFTAEADSGYTAEQNKLIKGADTYYGYCAAITGNGLTYKTVEAYVEAADDPEKNNTLAYKGTKFSGTSSVDFYILSNVELNKTNSRIYCE